MKQPEHLPRAAAFLAMSFGKLHKTGPVNLTEAHGSFMSPGALVPSACASFTWVGREMCFMSLSFAAQFSGEAEQFS